MLLFRPADWHQLRLAILHSVQQASPLFCRQQSNMIDFGMAVGGTTLWSPQSVSVPPFPREAHKKSLRELIPDHLLGITAHYLLELTPDHLQSSLPITFASVGRKPRSSDAVVEPRASSIRSAGQNCGAPSDLPKDGSGQHWESEARMGGLDIHKLWHVWSSFIEGKDLLWDDHHSRQTGHTGWMMDGSWWTWHFQWIANDRSLSPIVGMARDECLNSFVLAIVRNGDDNHPRKR
jgi:hypothetical protein